jgi:hypothetical protein
MSEDQLSRSLVKVDSAAIVLLLWDEVENLWRGKVLKYL